MSAWPSPEVMPALDETRPRIGPNLASDPKLCAAVAEHIWKDFGYGYMLQQSRLWPTWDRMDDAFRVKGKASDLDISATDAENKKANADGKGEGVVDGNDGVSAKVYPAAFHRQVRNKTDMHMSIAYADGSPVRVRKPDNLFENPAYNPETQQVLAAQTLLDQAIDAVGMKREDRKVRGSWSLYGHAWVHCDFKYRLIEVPCVHSLPPDPMLAIQVVQALALKYGSRPQFGQDQYGRQTATWQKIIVDPDSMVTEFMHIRHDAVFIDQTISAEDLDRQPCPGIRSHITRFELFGNDYDPQKNPFGWLNTRLALDKQTSHYALSAQDEGNLRRDLAKKQGLSDTGIIKARNTIKQLWTWYPMLAIDPATGLLDTGDGIECPTCRGRKEIPAEMVVGGQQPQQYSTLGGPEQFAPVIIGAGVPAAAPLVQSRQPCPQCQGVGKLFIEPKRYVVQMFGCLAMGAESSATVLRIQENPAVDNEVPLIFGAHLTEDTAGAIPLAVAEAAMKANDQLATAHNHVLNFKSRIIDRQWLVQSDEPHAKLPLNNAGRNIPYDSVKPEPAQSIAFDASANLTREYIPMMESDVQDLIGIPPTLMGQVSGGRRAATEIQTAADAAKLPITVEIDSCNTQIHGRWAEKHLRNIEAYGDRDWIQKRTGRTTFGRMKIHTEVAADFFTRNAQMQLLQNSIPAFAGIPGFNAAKAAADVFKLAKLPNAESYFDDGGIEKSRMDGFKIIAKILGDGVFVPPSQDDPHDLYCAMFSQALKDEEWQERAPEFMPMLAQRLQMQTQLLIQQQAQQMQAQMMEQQMLNPPQQGGGRANPKKPSQLPGNETQARQAQAGRDQPQ